MGIVLADQKKLKSTARKGPDKTDCLHRSSRRAPTRRSRRHRCSCRRREETRGQPFPRHSRPSGCRSRRFSSGTPRHCRGRPHRVDIFSQEIRPVPSGSEAWNVFPHKDRYIQLVTPEQPPHAVEEVAGSVRIIADPVAAWRESVRHRAGRRNPTRVLTQEWSVSQYRLQSVGISPFHSVISSPEM